MMRPLTVVLLASLLSLGCQGDSKEGPEQPHNGKKWTVLVYMMADNNLEPSGVEDLQEMMAGGSTEDVNIVVEADRHSKYSNAAVGGLGDWESTRRILVQPGTLEQLADLGEIDQATPTALAGFIEWGVSTYPADRYALVMWNHGMAWPGFGHDEKTNTHLDLLQLSQGIKEGLSQAGIARFELLGFDACLMGNVEVAHELADTAAYMLASEELEPGHGWDYAAITGFLKAQPDADGQALGKTIIDSYTSHARAKNENSARNITLSLVDTRKVEAVVSAVDQLAVKLTPSVQSREAWMALALSRNRTEEYGRTGDASSSSNVVDMSHLVEQMRFYGVQGIEEELQGLESALNDAVVHSVNSELRPHAAGLTLFFPTSPDLYDQKAQGYQQTAFGKRQWQSILSTYAATAKSDTTAPQLSGLDYYDDQGSFKASSQISGEMDDLAEAYFLLALNDGSKIQVLAAVPAVPDSDNTLKVNWDYRLPMLSDGTKKIWATLVMEFSNVWDVLEGQRETILGQIPVQVQSPDQQWHTGFVQVAQKLSGGGLSLLGTYLVTPGGMSQIQPGAGESYPMRMLYPVLTPDGSVSMTFDNDPASQLTLSSSPLTMLEEEVPEATYTFGFMVSDFSGNMSSTVTSEAL